MAFLTTPHVTQEHVPPAIEPVLIMFGWTKYGYSSNGVTFFTKVGYTGYYSWSEALVLELSKTFVELGKS
jgi:hypothetical protein